MGPRNLAEIGFIFARESLHWKKICLWNAFEAECDFDYALGSAFGWRKLEDKDQEDIKKLKALWENWERGRELIRRRGLRRHEQS
jgi:hypothetical protein